ncbi:hypothetical protein [Trichothermofontia sp.]
MKWWFSEYGWRLLPGGLAALFIAGLLQIGALQPLEQIAYRTRFQVRGEPRPPLPVTSRSGYSRLT